MEGNLKLSSKSYTYHSACNLVAKNQYQINMKRHKLVYQELGTCNAIGNIDGNDFHHYHHSSAGTMTIFLSLKSLYTTNNQIL